MDEQTKFWKIQTEFFQDLYHKQMQTTESYRKVVDDLMCLLNEKSREYTNLKLELEKACNK